MSLYLDLKEVANLNKTNRAVSFNGRVFSYEKLLTLIDNRANYFAKVLHFHENMSVSLCLYNSLDTLVMIYALNKIGVIINMINPSLSSDQILHFDSMIRSRVLILDTNIYQKYKTSFSHIKEKIALYDTNPSIFKRGLNILLHKDNYKVGVPLDRHYKDKEGFIKEYVNEDGVSLLGANERFYENPYTVCLTNKALHMANIGQKTIYEALKGHNLAFIDSNMMSISMFMTYYHACLSGKVCINVDNVSDKKNYIKLLKKNKDATLFMGDRISFSKLLSLKGKVSEKFISNLNSAYIYNDVQRSYIFNKFNNKIQHFNKKISLISLLGCSETSGAFLIKDISKQCDDNFGTFINGYDGKIIHNGKIKSSGDLYVKSPANMLGYFKQVKLNDELLTKDGFKTGYFGLIDENNEFHILNKSYKDFYFNGNLYIKNIKDILLTIPGVNDIDFSTSPESVNTMQCIVTADKTETIRLTNEVKKYLESQVKENNIHFDIKFLDKD